MPDNDNFSRAHAFTAHCEGGFSDHPADNGGLTAYGASLKFVKGIAATQQGRDWLQRIGFRLPVNKASMRSVTPDMAEAMFKREFWDRLRLDDMPFRPACALYDAAVNSGCAQSVKLAQRELLRRDTGEEPVLLLDDVLSELDDARQTYLLTRIEDKQTFVTTCDSAAFARTNGKLVFVDHGTVREG